MTADLMNIKCQGISYILAIVRFLEFIVLELLLISMGQIVNFKATVHNFCHYHNSLLDYLTNIQDFSGLGEVGHASCKCCQKLFHKT